jgi:transcriptional regulator with XRE-family HTH domain
MSKLHGPDLGTFLREQRQNARLSLRQLSELAGVSNPYLSQIERGLKKPSAEILQQLARGLEVSAETLYVQAGILDEAPVSRDPAPDVLQAIAADPGLTDRQRAVLVDVYQSFVGPPPTISRAPSVTTTAATPTTTPTTTPKRSTARSAASHSQPKNTKEN